MESKYVFQDEMCEYCDKHCDVKDMYVIKNEDINKVIFGHKECLNKLINENKSKNVGYSFADGIRETKGMNKSE